MHAPPPVFPTAVPAAAPLARATGDGGPPRALLGAAGVALLLLAAAGAVPLLRAGREARA